MKKLCVIILLLLFVISISVGCGYEDTIIEMPFAEPLVIDAGLYGLVGIVVHDIEINNDSWILTVTFENDSELMLMGGNVPDRLEYFDGEYWRSVPYIVPRTSEGVFFPPRQGYAEIYLMNEDGSMELQSSGVWPNEYEYEEIMRYATPWALGIGYLFERNEHEYRFMPWARPAHTDGFPQFTVRLAPHFFGVDGPEGDSLTELWPGQFRLRHRVWVDGGMTHDAIGEFIVPDTSAS